MTFTTASTLSVMMFLGVVTSVIGAVVIGISRSLPRTNAGFVFIGIAVWLGIVSKIVTSGALEAQPMPRLMFFLGACNLAGVLFALSSVGAALAKLPLPALIAFQAFRLPLEIILHSWARQGTIPGTMTWTGQNLDIVTGALAIPFAFIVARTSSLAAAWAFNIVGIASLLNVGRVAAMSSPLPFAWNVQPPLQLAFHMPYALIVPVCVAGALGGHIVLARALKLRARSGQ